MTLWEPILSGLSELRKRLAELFFPSPPDESGEKRGARWARLGFRLTLFLGFFSILVYAAQWDPYSFLRIASLGILLALAALLTGALLGFLFGIPRTLQQDSSAPAAIPAIQEDQSVGQPEYRGNTNLEQISDWLTKILVGITLTQFPKIKEFLQRLVTYLSPGFGKDTHNQPFILGILVLFPICGFFIGYLLTRLYLPLALKKSDLEGRRMKSLPEIDRQVIELRQVGAGIESLRPRDSDDPVLKNVREQVQVLAGEYERLRATMPSGNERTRSMELVATQMRALANIGAPLVDLLKNSTSPGERLAAVAFLQVHPDRTFLDWLADRVASEKPFLGYQAAVALLYAARSFGRDTLRAIQKAKSMLGPELSGTDSARTLDQAERAVLGG
jgi:hypothetical protein